MKNISKNLVKISLFFLFILTLFLYLYSPNCYSLNWIILSSIIYISTLMLYIKYHRIKNYFDFVILFTVAFFFVYYVYPLFIFSIMRNRFFMFNFKFNEKIITKATFLSLLGYQAFILGTMEKRSFKRHNFKLIDVRTIYNILAIIFTVMQFVFIKVFHYGNLYNENSASGGIYSYFIIINHGFFFSVLAIEFNRMYYEKKNQLKVKFNKIFFYSLFFNVLLVLTTGSRGEPIFITLAIIAGITYIRGGISIKQLVILIIVGFIGLSFIRIIRSGDNNISLNILDMGMDLIINNFTLYLGYDYVQNHGIILLPLFGSLFAAIPFLQGLLYSTFKIPLYTTTSALFFTHLVSMQNGKINFGVGTNIITSLYLSTGLIGVILFMFLLGQLVNSLRENIFNGTVYTVLLYLEMIGVSIYLVRADFFFPVGKFIFSLFFLMIFNTPILFQYKKE